MPPRNQIAELLFSLALLWMIGLALTIIGGVARAYVRGSIRLALGPVRFCLRRARRWLAAIIHAIGQWLGQRVRRW